MIERIKPDLASAMWPSLSREAKEREAAATQWREEQKRRNQQLASDLREMNRRLEARRNQVR